MLWVNIWGLYIFQKIKVTKTIRPNANSYDQYYKAYENWKNQFDNLIHHCKTLEY